MQLAAARGDIGSVVRLMTSTAALKPADYIKKTVGDLMFMYYGYVDTFHVRPVDIDDLVDGVLYMMAKGYVTKREMSGADSQKAR